LTFRLREFIGYVELRTRTEFGQTLHQLHHVGRLMQRRGWTARNTSPTHIWSIERLSSAQRGSEANPPGIGVYRTRQ
jgi:hypothetical protein